MSYDHILKYVLIGEPNVGKSSILSRFARLKTIEVDKRTVKLELWDTAGSERFRSITTAYYRGTHGILVVYDITNKQSFEEVQFWLNSARESAGNTVKIIIVGNKSDLSEIREVNSSEGKALADRNNVLFLETSARINTNISSVFAMLASEIIAAYPRDTLSTRDYTSFTLDNTTTLAESESRCGCL